MLENNIKNLIKILEESKVDELEISTFWGKQKIKIRKNSVQSLDRNIELIQTTPTPPIINTLKDAPNVPAKIGEENVATKSEEQNTVPVTDDNTVTIKAPLVGTYYRSSKPDIPAFISEGDIIKPGQVLCIIEAMKIFNEIESEISGKVVKILIKDGTPVEYDQDLIIIAPE
ncbi:MAG TPA: acetyl-CoA carboxylase biotin carboxyl carrier protein [Candidatus Marinimicrobia bacterium]|nr:acetyl-CoA carboxylase biotin carboxyl carrier protein [Candidatus Neomarinimicrobiota bacterium]